MASAAAPWLGGQTVQVRWKALFAVREVKGESFWCVPCTDAVSDDHRTGGNAAVILQLWDSEHWS